MRAMSDELPQQIHFDFIKSNHFRVVHVDGAWGGLTPNGHVNMVLYSERPPIPKQMTHQVNPDGAMKEIKELRLVRDTTAIREVEVSAIMPAVVARALRDWLTERLIQLDEIKKKISDDAGSDQSATGDEPV